MGIERLVENNIGDLKAKIKERGKLFVCCHPAWMVYFGILTSDHYKHYFNYGQCDKTSSTTIFDSYLAALLREAKVYLDDLAYKADNNEDKEEIKFIRLFSATKCFLHANELLEERMLLEKLDREDTPFLLVLPPEVYPERKSFLEAIWEETKKELRTLLGISKPVNFNSLKEYREYFNSFNSSSAFYVPSVAANSGRLRRKDKRVLKELFKPKNPKTYSCENGFDQTPDGFNVYFFGGNLNQCLSACCNQFASATGTKPKIILKASISGNNYDNSFISRLFYCARQKEEPDSTIVDALTKKRAQFKKHLMTLTTLKPRSLEFYKQFAELYNLLNFELHTDNVPFSGFLEQMKYFLYLNGQ